MKKQIDLMIGFISEMYTKKISIDEIAMAGGVCRNKCCQIFKMEKNTSPNNYLNDYRLKIAKELLSSSSKSIAQVAKCSGFASQSYFSRLFSKKFGETPFEFRVRTAQQKDSQTSIDRIFFTDTMWNDFSQVAKVNLLTGEFTFIKQSEFSLANETNCKNIDDFSLGTNNISAILAEDVAEYKKIVSMSNVYCSALQNTGKSLEHIYRRKINNTYSPVKFIVLVPSNFSEEFPIVFYTQKILHEIRPERYLIPIQNDQLMRRLAND